MLWVSLRKLDYLAEQGLPRVAAAYRVARGVETEDESPLIGLDKPIHKASAIQEVRVVANAIDKQKLMVGFWAACTGERAL
jgi:hypothetical protein